MTDMTNPDSHKPLGDLSSLWQSGGDIPVESLIERLKQQNSRLRRLNQLSFAVCAVSLVLIAALEFIGRLPTQGLLTVVGVLSVAWGWRKYKRDKARLIAAYSQEPAQLLPFLIKRTKAARNLGRYYYLTPTPSIVLGYLFGRFTDVDTSSSPPDAVMLPLVGAALAIMLGITLWGVKLARQKTKELKELRALLKELPEE